MSLGIIGGMGPMATACFLELLTDMTYAKCDQDHLETIIYSCPQIPDRTSFILGRSDQDPAPKMNEIAHKLQDEGVDAIAIPCVTAGFFRERIEQDIDIPVLYGVDYLASTLKDRGIRNAGIMATDGTIEAGVIQKVLESNGINAVIPTAEDRALVMSLIYDDVKTGRDPDVTKLEMVMDHLRKQGAETSILGCTELSVIRRNHTICGNYFDILEMLAEESLKACGKRIKK